METTRSNASPITSLIGCWLPEPLDKQLSVWVEYDFNGIVVHERRVDHITQRFTQFADQLGMGGTRVHRSSPIGRF
jgi:hypothetical protein